MIDHRIVRKDNKDRIELKVKWNGYSETTWESFGGSVKDAATLVEKYLIRKGLVENMNELNELKRLKEQL